MQCVCHCVERWRLVDSRSGDGRGWWQAKCGTLVGGSGSTSKGGGCTSAKMPRCSRPASQAFGTQLLRRQGGSSTSRVLGLGTTVLVVAALKFQQWALLCSQKYSKDLAHTARCQQMAGIQGNYGHQNIDWRRGPTFEVKHPNKKRRRRRSPLSM